MKPVHDIQMLTVCTCIFSSFHNCRSTQTFMRCQTFHCSRCSSLSGSLSFQAAVIEEDDDSKLLRSRQAEQIIPAVLPKADSRIELSDPGEGGGGLSASNLSFKHLSGLHLPAWKLQRAALRLRLPSGKFWERIFGIACVEPPGASLSLEASFESQRVAVVIQMVFDDQKGQLWFWRILSPCLYFPFKS